MCLYNFERTSLERQQIQAQAPLRGCNGNMWYVRSNLSVNNPSFLFRKCPQGSPGIISRQVGWVTLWHLCNRASPSLSSLLIFLFCFNIRYLKCDAWMFRTNLLSKNVRMGTVITWCAGIFAPKLTKSEHHERKFKHVWWKLSGWQWPTNAQLFHGIETAVGNLTLSEYFFTTLKALSSSWKYLLVYKQANKEHKKCLTLRF